MRCVPSGDHVMTPCARAITKGSGLYVRAQNLSSSASESVLPTPMEGELERRRAMLLPARIFGASW